MADQSSSPGRPNQPPNTVAAPIAAEALPAGSPVYVSGMNEVSLAQADALSEALVIGVVPYAIEVDERAPIQKGGSLELPAEQWDALTGDDGGLTPGDIYYLSDATAGLITTTAPSTTDHYQTIYGVALSPTDMYIIAGTPVKNLGV